MVDVSFDAILGLGLSPKTAYQYARLIDLAQRFFAERGVTLATCEPGDVAAFAQTTRNSNSTRALVRAALVAGWQIVGRYDGPARAVRVPPKPTRRCRALEDGTAQTLERAAWERRDDAGLAVLIGLYTGLRRFEIAKLRWEDFLLDDTGRADWLRVQGKGDVSAEIPVHPVLADALEPIMRRRGWVFPGRSKGEPVCAATIWAYVRQVAVDAGLGEIRTHVLRHTALAEANDRSGDLRAVQDFARHSRPETTAGYTRTRSARLREVVAMIDYGRRTA